MTDQNTGERIAGPPPAAQPQPPLDHPGQHGAEQLARLEEQARTAINQLAEVPDPDAFQALLRLSALVGEGLGINARALATSGSWAKVAEVAGTSRQAAWSRWSS